ncbi:MAG: hypothetical protein ACFFE5_09545, partial [Candidatus Thorarchaeota archaeon]
KTILGNTTFPFPNEDGLHTIQVFGNDSLGTMYESDLKSFSVRFLNIISPENKSYYKPMSGYYPATYGFENDEVDSVPFGWTDQSGGPTWCKVITSEDGHNNVLQLYDTTGGDPYAVNPINNKESGTVEFWLKNVDMAERVYFAPRNGTTQLFRVLLADNMAKVTAQGPTGHDLAAASADTWYHFSVDFECGTGNYKSLGQYEFAVTYHGIRYGPYKFWNNASFADDITFSGFWGYGNYYYVDAVGYSWDPDYSIGDNLNEGLLLSFQNKTAVEWLGYSLDDQPIKTILGNTTFCFPRTDGLHTIQVFGNDPLGTDFESDIRYFSIKILNIITPENITYNAPMSGYYPATYGFENDGIGSDPEEWVIWNEDDIIEIVSEAGGHKNVLRLYDSSSSTQNHIQQEFSAKDYGQIECWVRTSDVGDHVAIIPIASGGATLLFSLDINNDNFEVQTGTGTHIIRSASDNQWYHIKIVFRASYGNAYQGLTSTYTWKLYIDGVQYGDYAFQVNQDVEGFRASTANLGASVVDFYIDAVGFSWDPNYNIGDNMDEGILLSFTN